MDEPSYISIGCEDTENPPVKLNKKQVTDKKSYIHKSMRKRRTTSEAISKPKTTEANINDNSSLRWESEKTILNLEDLEKDESDSELVTNQSIDYAKTKRKALRGCTTRLFKKIDIEESTSIKNREMYNFVVDDDSEEHSDYSPEENTAGVSSAMHSKDQYETPRSDKLKNKIDSTSFKNPNLNHEKLGDFYSQSSLSLSEDITNIKRIEEAINALNNQKVAWEEKESGLNQERSSADDDLKVLEAKEQKFADAREKYDKMYEFFQHFRDKINALCYCLTEKMPLIESCTEELLNLHKQVQHSKNQYYYSEDGDLKDILTDFDSKKARIYQKSQSILSDVNENIVDIEQLLRLFLFVKENYFYVYIKNFLPESIPSLIVPLLGHFFITFDPAQNSHQLEIMISLLKVLDCSLPETPDVSSQQGAAVEKLDLTEDLKVQNFKICERVCDFVLFRYLKEFIEFEWDEFSERSTEFLIRIFCLYSANLEGLHLSFRVLFKSLFERLSNVFMRLNKAVSEGNAINENPRIFLKNFKKVLRSVFLKNHFLQDKEIVNLIKIYYKSSCRRSSSDLTDTETEEKIIELNIATRNILKSLSD